MTARAGGKWATPPARGTADRACVDVRKSFREKIAPIVG